MAEHDNTATVHSVHFYENHSSLVERLKAIVVSGLQAGNAVLIVATDEHRQQLLQALEKDRLEIRQAEGEGRFILCDAELTLRAFMVNGRPDPQGFIDTVGSLVLESKKAIREGKGLTVFGEMVSVLWNEGNKVGAIELEKLWNDLLNGIAFHLHCAYPRWIFNEEAEGQELRTICDSHTHVVGNGVPAKPVIN